MAAFEYKALDTSGQTVKGVLQGDTARGVRQTLRDQGLSPLEVNAVAAANKSTDKVNHRVKLNSSELALITRQLATLTEAGIPLEEALQTAAQQNEIARHKRILVALRSRVMEGHNLSVALEEFPKAFPDIFRASVAAGEQTGNLDRVLSRLADHAETREELGRRALLAMLYPAFIAVVALLVVGGLLTYVVPQVVQVFTGMNQELPVLTRVLISASELLRNHLWVLLSLIGLIAIGFSLAMSNANSRSKLHALVLRLPLAGRLSRALNTARFCRTFSILSASGVPALDSLKIAATVMTNLPMRDAAEQAAAQVREGSAIARALRSTQMFPPMVTQLIASGEQSGRLDKMLGRAADTTEREADNLLSGLMAILEPLLILVVGVMVLLVVLAILLPIFDMNQLVQ